MINFIQELSIEHNWIQNISSISASETSAASAQNQQKVRKSESQKVRKSAVLPTSLMSFLIDKEEQSLKFLDHNWGLEVDQRSALRIKCVPLTCL